MWELNGDTNFWMYMNSFGIHMVYVLKCMAQIPPKVRNIRAYALSTLYNSYVILQRGPVSEKRRRWAREHYQNWHEAD